MSMDAEQVVVIGGSAGAFEELREILEALPADLPAAVMAVMHLEPRAESQLPRALGRRAALPVKFGEDGERVAAGAVYLAPPDRHMLVRDGAVVLSSGPTENYTRPAIDVLFRSAAVAFTGRCVGVLLSGQNDDGADGLRIIAECGGAALVRDPAQTIFPRMPRAAQRVISDAFVGEPAAIAKLIVEQLDREREEGGACPPGLRDEVELTHQASHGCPPLPDPIGAQVPLACPECGGPLWQVGAPDHPRYRCHIAHAYTLDGLGEAQHRELTRALYAAQRMMRERARLLRRGGSASQRIDEYEGFAEELRALLDRLVNDPPGDDTAESPVAAE